MCALWTGGFIVTSEFVGSAHSWACHGDKKAEICALTSPQETLMRVMVENHWLP